MHRIAARRGMSVPLLLAPAALRNNSSTIPGLSRCLTGSPVIEVRIPLRMNTRCVRLGLALGLLLCSATAAQPEQRLNADDVLEISVAGVPELRQRVVVQGDGTISFPLLGTIGVAGLFPSEVRAKVQATLATKAFRQKTADGRETVVVIEPDQVTTMVAEFRPIFVNGDVARPGQQPFHAFMTVREAVALSGGYDIMRFRINRSPFLESADLRSEYEGQWTEFVKEQARTWRIRAELGIEAKIDNKTLMEAPILRSTITEILNVESEQLELHQRDYIREAAYLQGVVNQAESHIKTLSEQLRKEDEGLEADAQDLQRLTELFSKGATVVPRVTDARRALLWSATRKLQTTSQLMQIQKLRSDYLRQLERLHDDRRTNLLRELQDSSVRLSEIRSRLQAIGEKLEYIGIVKSQLVRGKGPKPELVVVRKGDDGRRRLMVDEDFEIQPGDVIEVALHEPPDASVQ
jgi:polysaccharide export outer membrane protein